MHCADYGTWESPIKVETLAEKSLRFDQVCVDGNDLYWLELRPDEGGRSALVKNGLDIMPDENIRSRIHEYGGGSYCAENSQIIFTRYSDQNLYLYKDGRVTQITQESNARFAEPLFDPKRDLVYAICEKHEQDSVENFIVRIDVKTQEIKTIAKGADFYACLQLHPDQTHLAYIRWSHPHMPWDATELILATLDPKGEIISENVIAGNPANSVMMPSFDQSGELIYLSDASGYWNFYMGQTALTHEKADFGEPLWVLGNSRYGFIGKTLYTIRTTHGRDELGVINGSSFHSLGLPFTGIKTLRTQGDDLIFIASSPQTSSALYRYNVTKAELILIRQTPAPSLASEWVSLPEEITFSSSKEALTYGFYYPPKNPNYKAPLNSLPPLIVRCHGGPSAHYTPSMNLETLFWTSRGFGVVDVNYGGSTGYGRAYRERLNLNWGLVDVDDVIAAAEHLVKLQKADPEKLFIRGGSSGGYTLLCALIKTPIFKAATCLYGVSDLKGLDASTHKFEAHYSDSLLGTEKERIYRERSPIYHADKIKTPILFLQGNDDMIVPKAQTEEMAKALRKNDIPCEVKLFEGEGHGFRKATTIKQAIESELNFYKHLLTKS